MTEAVTVDTTQVGPVTILKAGPSLTFDDGNLGLQRAVVSQLAAGARAFVITVSAVTAIDSFGVAEVVSCHTTIARGGGRLILAAPSRKVREVLAVTRLDGVIEIRETEADAVAALQAV